MLIFKVNREMCGEEYDRWRDYFTSKEPKSILLPEYIDYLGNTDNDGIDYMFGNPSDFEEE